MSIPKASANSWSQTMRNLVRKRFLKKASGRPADLAAPSAAEPPTPSTKANKANKKPSAKRLPSAETEASGTGSSQTWEDFGEFALLSHSPLSRVISSSSVNAP